MHLPLLTDGVVVLRPLALADVDAHIAGEDAELVRWLSDGPSTRKATTAYVRRGLLAWAAGGPAFSFGIRGAGDDVLQGTIEAQLARPYLAANQANLAYGLYPHARGQGLATRAVILAREFLARCPDVDEAVIRVHPGNPASAAVALRAGFRYAGRQQDLDWYTRPAPGSGAAPGGSAPRWPWLGTLRF